MTEDRVAGIRQLLKRLDEGECVPWLAADELRYLLDQLQLWQTSAEFAQRESLRNLEDCHAALARTRKAEDQLQELEQEHSTCNELRALHSDRIQRAFTEMEKQITDLEDQLQAAHALAHEWKDAAAENAKLWGPLEEARLALEAERARSAAGVEVAALLRGALCITHQCRRRPGDPYLDTCPMCVTRDSIQRALVALGPTSEEAPHFG